MIENEELYISKNKGNEDELNKALSEAMLSLKVVENKEENDE